MFSLLRLVAVVSVVLPVAFAAPLNFTRETPQGQPISVARTADRSAEASTIFGTTTDSPNFTKIPTTLCIVPEYANEAGIGEEKTPLITQQALELCPQAARIAVHQQ